MYTECPSVCLHPLIALIWTKDTPVMSCQDCTGAADVRPVSFLTCNTQTKPRSWNVMVAFDSSLWQKSFLHVRYGDMPGVKSLRNHKYSQYFPPGLYVLWWIMQSLLLPDCVGWCIIFKDPFKWRWDVSSWQGGLLMSERGKTFGAWSER